MKFEEALSYAKSKRVKINPNIGKFNLSNNLGFISQLKDFEEEVLNTEKNI